MTSLSCLVPPTTALMAHLLFAESLTAGRVLVMLLTIGGVALVVRMAAAGAQMAPSGAWGGLDCE